MNKYIKITKPLPQPESDRIIRALRRKEPHTITDQLPIVWRRAVDFLVEDNLGNRYLDFTSGIFVANAGHANPEVCAAIKKAIDRQLLFNYHFASINRLEFLETLLSTVPKNLTMAVTLSTGAEATEVALKIMRYHGLQQRPRKDLVISYAGGFHGKTLGAQLMGGKAGEKSWIGRLDPRFKQLPFPMHTDPLRDATPIGKWKKEIYSQLKQRQINPKRVAGFILEPYQGWSAAFFPINYVKALREITRRHRAILTFDEVQSGFGRTGKLFAYEHFGVQADLVTCGKGISGSLPLSAVLGPKKLVNIPGGLGSTHSGNTLAIAAGIATIKYLAKHHLVKKALAKGKIFEKKFRYFQKKYGIERIPYISSAGMVGALHIHDPKTGKLDAAMGNRIIEKALQKGLLFVKTDIGTIKFGPPLTMPVDAINESLSVLEKILDELLIN